MFQFPGFAIARYGFTIAGCPIRTPADQWSFAPPRSFSQLAASFVASESLGIHRVPLVRFLPPQGLSFQRSLLVFTFFLSQLVNELLRPFAPLPAGCRTSPLRACTATGFAAASQQAIAESRRFPLPLAGLCLFPFSQKPQPSGCLLPPPPARRAMDVEDIGVEPMASRMQI